jgi:hypothetical protein
MPRQYIIRIEEELLEGHKCLMGLYDAIHNLKPHDSIVVVLDQCVWGIDCRPHYCDRGRYLWKNDSTHPHLGIDNADMFPRYYFAVDAMFPEMLLWCAQRKQTIKGFKEYKSECVPLPTTGDDPDLGGAAS